MLSPLSIIAARTKENHYVEGLAVAKREDVKGEGSPPGRDTGIHSRDTHAKVW
jgi:hypothetical protein